MTTITLPELEAAINFWRARSPAVGEELRLCREAAALAEPYALMILARRRTLEAEELDPTARQAFDTWRQAQP